MASARPMYLSVTMLVFKKDAGQRRPGWMDGCAVELKLAEDSATCHVSSHHDVQTEIYGYVKIHITKMYSGHENQKS